MPSFLEWECRSKIIYTVSFSINFFIAYMIGSYIFDGYSHLRLESQPKSSALVFPWTTPSTFIMGTILKTNLFNKNSDYSLLDSRKSMIPSIIKLAVVSPGCWRDMIQIDFFYRSLSLLVIWNILISLPPKVCPILLTLILLACSVVNKVLVR